MQICRAEDGQVYQVNATLKDIERLGSLELFLQQETGVDEESVLAYLSDGRRLRSENFKELAGVQDQTIFVYNKRYLDLDLNLVLRDLRIEPPIEPPIEDTIAATPPFRPSQLATSYLRTAQIHRDHIKNSVESLTYQHDALRISSSSLDLNVLEIVNVFEEISSGAQKELEKQEVLLSGVDADLEIISRMRIHAEFMSPAVRKAMEAGERARTLGDYVSNMKMRQVAETCAKSHADLRLRFLQVQDTVSRLNQGADDVRANVSNTILLTDADGCKRRSLDILNKITDAAAMSESPTSDADKLLQELRQSDLSLRNELIQITEIKNSYTELCIGALRRISVLNDDLVQLPAALTSLQASLRTKTSFSHIQRLHNMLHAYGATIVEIVRRKEFARFFYQRAHSILEVMAKLSSAERKRRQVYRGEMHGQLPFEIRGMEDTVPTIDFSPTGSVDSHYSLERVDVDNLILVLDDLERFAQSANDSAAINSVQESRSSLEKLIAKMDGIESGFDRIAERALLSASWLSSHRRRSAEDAYEELAEQFRELQQSSINQQTLFQAEKSALEAEIVHLRSTHQEIEFAVRSDRDRADALERELHSARAQIESDATCRRILDTRNAELLADTENLRKELADALADATEQTVAVGMASQELAQIKAEYEDVKTLEERHAQRIATLLEDQAQTIRNLEDARLKGQDMESQVRAVSSESEEMKRALLEATREKDRLLRLQASEHDRIIRDHIAEADGDRAVLEHQFSELKATVENAERQLKDARTLTEMAQADSQSLREEIQRLEHELREAHHVEQVLRNDLRDGRASQSDYDQRLEDSTRLVAQLLDVAIAFRNSHVKATASAQAMTAHPAVSKSSPSNPNISDSIFSPPMRHTVIGQHDEPSPVDPSDPVTAIEVLRSFDHDQFLEIIGKTGSTIRKWQKQCKEYRERAKGKISFRNFAKGDLALFLPTRNSVSKPWAAFNVSFPHYFLSATGHLAEQLKTREWIVARITLITERVVDYRDPSSNPYGLGDGVKYYMLEVEDWTQQPNHPSKRRASARKASSATSGSMPKWENGIPVPTEPEVEEAFNEARPRVFPSRSRANSTPVAGPSSLSRLLAQAGLEQHPLEPVSASREKSPSPIATSPSVTESNQHQSGRTPPNPHQLRPGSRASRVSITSRISMGRLPGGPGTTKASPTTAITEQPVSATGSSGDSASISMSETNTSVVSPEEFLADDMSSLLKQHHRRRTTSTYSVSRSSPLAHPTAVSAAVNTNVHGFNGTTTTSAGSRLANLATSWGVTFGRRKRADEGPSLDSIAQAPSSSEDLEESPTAREILNKF